MQENVGDVDRWVRVGVGGSLALTGLVGLRRGQLAPALMLAGGVMLLETAITRVCPINALLHIDTRRIRALLTSSTSSDSDSEDTGERGGARQESEAEARQESDVPATNIGSVPQTPSDF